MVTGFRFVKPGSRDTHKSKSALADQIWPGVAEGYEASPPGTSERGCAKNVKNAAFVKEVPFVKT